MSYKKETILEWYQKNHRYIDAPCNGKGNCGRCKIKFLSNPPSASRKDLRLLSFDELKEGIRLACTTEKTEREDFVPVGSFLQQDIFVPQMEEEITRGGIEQETEFGIAVDIGTTTLAMSLIGLRSGACYSTVTQVNHQRSFGSDVISRIQAANEGHLLEMRESVRLDLIEMLRVVIEKTGIQLKQMTEMAIAGNTVMCHLLQGFSCEGLGRAPFKTVSTALAKMELKELFSDFRGLPEQKAFLEKLQIKVTILPGISAFVGSDVTAGIYACEMDLKEECQMLIDVGTNGEMVIGNQNGFLAASAAAGPVFEAGNISCGMPAQTGAVSHIRYRLEKNANEEPLLKWECRILGSEGTKAKGLCGSGLIDLVSELWRLGIIDENGTFCEPYFENGFAVPVKCKETEKQIVLSQTDVRELQMGKAAIRAGMELLMQKIQPEKIYLAGGFGTAIDKNAAAGIGLFPKQFLGQIVPVGNTALLGAKKYLLDKKGEERITRIAGLAKEVSLAKDSDFQEKYIHFMQFLV